MRMFAPHADMAAPMALNPLDADLSLDLAEGNTLATPLTGHGCSLLVRSRACHTRPRAPCKLTLASSVNIKARQSCNRLLCTALAGSLSSAAHLFVL